MSAAPAAVSWSPWRAVVGFGVVSLSADMVYEGARSITGPLLAFLGASAVLVGLVTGAGEALALVLRLVFGTWADRSGRYWTLTFAGYALTAVCVPALAVTPFLAGAGLALAAFSSSPNGPAKQSEVPPRPLFSPTPQGRSGWAAASQSTKHSIKLALSPGRCSWRESPDSPECCGPPSPFSSCPASLPSSS